MLDRLRRDIQTRLDELLSEAAKLRHALAALTSRDGATAAKTNGSSSATRSRRRSRPVSASPAPSRTTARPRRSTTSRQSPTAGVSPETAESQATARSQGSTTAAARTAPGATKAAVLKALANGSAMTAGEVAAATGLGRASVSTTLSKLAKKGEVIKAARGYQIAGQSSTASATAEAD